jgi:AAA+ superfamily predicted ATPase
LGTEVFTAVAPFLEKPNWWNGVKAAFAIGKVFVDEVELWSEDYFAGDEWNLPYSRDFNQTIIKVITGYPYETIRTSDENNIIRIVDVEGIKCGYIMNTKLSAIDNIYVETARLQDARNVIKRLLWEQFKDAILVMRQNKRLVLHDDESRVLFELDDAFHSMPSRRASNYAAYLKRCIDANVSRSVMLYGPPGTGKSTMARTIVTELKMRSFRIRVEDVAGLESSTLFEAISIFEPDAIILDDFDRAHAQAQLLETLEFFQRHVKLVIATVNDRNSLDEAILRPGRFDELLLINEMEPEVIEAVLGPELKDAMKSVKDWPIAFIQEYVKRRRFMSAEEAEASTKELADRVKRLEKYKDVDEVERMHRLTRKHLKMTKVEIEEDDEEDGPDTDPPDPNYNLDKDVEIVKVSHDEVEEVERSFDRK